MNVHFSPKLQHLFLALTTVLAVVSTSRPAFAARDDCGSNIVPIYETATPCGFELAGTEELCGWIPLGTHDSAPSPTLAPPKLIAKPARSEVDAGSEIQESLAVLAATACRSAGVSVEQIVEPFVMVGPYLDNSVTSVEAFQSWWAESLAEMIPKADPLQAQLDAIAAQEPVDVESFGVSILVFAAIPEEGRRGKNSGSDWENQAGRRSPAARQARGKLRHHRDPRRRLHAIRFGSARSAIVECVSSFDATLLRPQSHR